jgi:DNA-binding response OmpR family regulator
MTFDVSRGSSTIRVVLIGESAAQSAVEWSGVDAAVESVPTVSEAVRRIRNAPPDGAVVFASNALAAEMCAVLRQLGHFAIGVVPESLTENVAIDCLERGADFALTSPVTPAEMIARLHGAVRRNAPEAEVIVTGDISIDLGRHEVTRNGTPVAMTRTEFRVLAALASRIGQVVSTTELLQTIWGEEFVRELHYVRLYIGYLRNKLEEDPSHPRLIVTHRLEGYQLTQL